MAIKQKRSINHPGTHAWFAPGLPPLTRAVYLTLAYADIFQYPLKISELHRRLIGFQTTREELISHMSGGNIDPHSLVFQDGYYALAGREGFISTRKKRAALSRTLWPQADKYGHLIARLPFVRMVAVTGALAVHNVEADTDLDYLIVAEPGRLWTCRAWAVALVRLAALQGIVLCPNYFISAQALTFQEQTLYTAHEVIQMVPVVGQSVYEEIRRNNAWSAGFLPNAAGPPDPNNFGSDPTQIQKKWMEAPFKNGIGTRLEEWEMNRKIRKFARLNGNSEETSFSPEYCKGHFAQHGQQALDTFYARLKELEAIL